MGTTHTPRSNAIIDEKDRDDHGRHTGGRSSPAAGERPSHHGTRRVFFVATGVCGFVLGWLALPLGESLAGHPPLILDLAALVTSAVLLACTVGAAALISRLYSDYRHRRR